MHLFRRTTAVAATVLVTALALPGVASAATSATITSPVRDATVAGPTVVRVDVTRELLDAEVERVELRISRDGRTRLAGTQVVALSCVADCGADRSVWAAPDLDPRTMSPFGASPVCNGRWQLQPSLDGGPFASGSSVVFAAAPTPPRDVRTSVDGRDATVSWTAAPEPDVVGYRVERRVDGGPWRTVTTVASDRTQTTTPGLAPGRYEHRVVTLRPDGFTDGAPAAPCADRDPDLAATSAVSSASVADPSDPSASPSSRPPSGSPSQSPTTGGDPGTGAGGDGPGPGGGDPATGGTGGDPADPGTQPSDGEQPPARTPGRRIGAPPSARSSGARLDAPTLPNDGGGAAREDVYFGEDDPFSEEIDYGDAAAIAGESGSGTRTVTQRVSGGVEVFVERFVDPERILRPIAAGLLALTLGLHVRRWARDQ